MLHLTVNGLTHDIPDGWHEVKFSEVDKLINSSGDTLFDLCGLPSGIAILLSLEVQDKIQRRLDTLINFPTITIDKVDVSSLPFGKYVSIVQAATPLDRLRTLYPDVLDNVQDCLPLYTALNDGMIEFHERWKILEAAPAYELKNAGVDRLEPFGIYGLITSLVKGDITKEEELMKLETGHIFLHRSYHKVASEVQQQLNHNRRN